MNRNVVSWAGCLLLLLGVGRGVVAEEGERGREPFRPSVEVFLEEYTDLVAGKRVALLTNPTGIDSHFTPTVDLLQRDERVNLVALLGPEHGVRGNAEAGKHVENQVDPGTGLPVYSLYSAGGYGPSDEVLSGIDTFIYHIQDVGCREYTYIWSMAICMKKAAEQGKEFIVFDVPNPNLHVGIDGPRLDDGLHSFVGLYDVPYLYGMTVGELARYLNTEENIHCNLTVIPMKGYRRSMLFEETGMPWVPSSPNIPNLASVIAYPITGPAGEFETIHVGANWMMPFQVVGTPYLDADQMAQTLNGYGFEGIFFRPIHYRATSGYYAGKDLHGVQLHILDARQIKPQVIAYALMSYLFSQKEFEWPDEARRLFFAKITGSKRFEQDFRSGRAWQEMVAEWEEGQEEFRKRSEPYYLYLE